MHEWALAEAVVEAVRKALDEADARRVTRVVVAVGELQQIDRETFRLALVEVMPAADLRLAGECFELVAEPARLHCRQCQAEFGLAQAAPVMAETTAEALHFIPELAHAFLRCPRCQSADFSILSGRGITVSRIEAE